METTNFNNKYKRIILDLQNKNYFNIRITKNENGMPLVSASRDTEELEKIIGYIHESDSQNPYFVKFGVW